MGNVERYLVQDRDTPYRMEVTGVPARSPERAAEIFAYHAEWPVSYVNVYNPAENRFDTYQIKDGKAYAAKRRAEG